VRGPFAVGFFVAGCGLAAFDLVLVLLSVASVLPTITLTLLLALRLMPPSSWLKKRGLWRVMIVPALVRPMDGLIAGVPAALQAVQ